MVFLYILLLSMPFYRHPILNAGSGLVTTEKGLGLLCALTALVHVIRHGVPNYLETRQAKLFFAIVALAVFSFVRKGEAPDLDLGAPILIYVSLVGFFFMIVTLVDTPQKLRGAVLASLIGMAFAALYVLREVQRYHGLSEARPGYVVGDANYFSLAAMLAVPVGYFWFIAERNKFYRWMIFLTLLPTSVAVAFAASRGGLLALIVFGLFVLFRSRHRIRNASIVTLLLLPPMVLVPRNPIARFIHPELPDIKAAQFRIVTIKAGLRMIRTHPLLGIGLGGFKPQVGKYTENPKLSKMAHNTYLELAAELGVVCLLVYLWLLWETYRSLAWTRRIAARYNATLLHSLVTGLQGGLIGYLVSSFFLSAEYVKWFWFYVFLSIALACITRKWALKQEQMMSQPSPA